MRWFSETYIYVKFGAFHCFSFVKGEGWKENETYCLECTIQRDLSDGSWMWRKNGSRLPVFLFIKLISYLKYFRTILHLEVIYIFFTFKPNLGNHRLASLYPFRQWKAGHQTVANNLHLWEMYLFLQYLHLQAVVHVQS